MTIDELEIALKVFIDKYYLKFSQPLDLSELINEYDIDSGEMKNYAFISSIKEIIRNINI